MYLKILLWRFELLQMYLFYCVTLQKPVEQNPVIPNINSGATHYIIYSISAKLYLLYYLLYTNLKHMWKCNMYYRPDMG